MGSCAHFMNSERFRNLFGPTVDDCYWTDVSGLHASSNFRTIYLGISNNFWCGFWVNGQLLHCFCLLIIRLNVGSLAFLISCTCLRTGLLSGGRKQMWCICDYTGLETFTLEAWKYTDEIWNLNVRNSCDHLKLIMTTKSCYADWVETCRNLSGQELSNNSSSFCSSGTQSFHLPMYLCDYSFLMMRWNHKWGLGWKALSYIIR